tara:strand:+ start:866 stop:1012 length:147 start_codon:yes stop_codon:yes gene_type:complete
MNDVIITAYKGSSKVVKIVKKEDTSNIVGYVAGYCQCLIDNGYEVVID